MIIIANQKSKRKMTPSDIMRIAFDIPYILSITKPKTPDRETDIWVTWDILFQCPIGSNAVGYLIDIDY